MKYTLKDNASYTIKIFEAFFLIAFILCCIRSAAQDIGSNITVDPLHFKAQIPCIITKGGIIIDSYWGTSRILHKVYFDNHSPTWASNNVIQNNTSILKSKGYLYRTTTADGTYLEGDIYTCGVISLGTIAFNNISFYGIATSLNFNNQAEVDGVFGENMIRKGVWKIDFKNQNITFASNLDSLANSQEIQLFPTRFLKDAFLVDIRFRNNIIKTIELDLGYNGDILMPSKEFLPIARGNKKSYVDSFRFTTPASIKLIKNTQTFDTISVQQAFYQTIISSNEIDKEVLIGRGFFKQFEFVILDYINKCVYISKKRLY